MAGLATSVSSEDLAARFSVPGATVLVERPEPRHLDGVVLDCGFAFVDVQGAGAAAVNKIVQAVCPSLHSAMLSQQACGLHTVSPMAKACQVSVHVH